MRTRRALIALLFAAPISAQEVQQQGMVVSWPSYTEQQRWNRSNFLAIGFYAATIGYAKSRGQTAEDVGRYFGDLYAPGWGAANSGVAIRVARGFVLNAAASPNTDAMLVAATDTSATARFRRTHVPLFGPTGEMNGAKLAEYDRMFTVIGDRIAAHLGLRYSERIDGEWMTVTFTGRGANAITAMPRGVFTATLTAEQAGGANFAGASELTFFPDGRFELSSGGMPKVRGRSDVSLDQILLREETGEWACTGFGPGTYRFTPQQNGDIVFGSLNDMCPGRVRFIARRWTKK